MLPQISIVSLKTEGLGQLADAASTEQAEVMGLEEALTSHHDFDAFLVTHHVLNKQDQVDPNQWRLRKKGSIVGDIQKLGGRVVCWGVVLDYDLPQNDGSKQPWTPELESDFFDALNDCAEAGWSRPFDATAFYLTKHGARWIYVLKSPVGPAQAEVYGAALRAEFGQHGFDVDEACKDWTRLFRLPNVRRDGEDLEVEVDLQPDKLLDPRTLDCSAIVPDVPQISRTQQSMPRPDDGEAQDMRHNPGFIEWLKKARKKLKGKCDSYFVAFDYEDFQFGHEGSRDETMWRVLGRSMGILRKLEDTCPEYVYALFYPAANLMTEADQEGEDWCGLMWDKICRTWESYMEQDHQKQMEREAERIVARSTRQQILHTMRSYLPRAKYPDLHSDDEDIAWGWVDGHLLIALGNSYHVMGPDGYYDRESSSMANLPAKVRALEMDASDIIPLWKDTDNGPKPLPAQALVNRHCTFARTVKGSSCVKGGILHHASTPDACLELPLFGLNEDLVPTFNQNVDDWLTQLVGPSRKPALEEWIAGALSFDKGPICAVSLIGPPACGKSMFMQGLAECLRVPVTVGPEQAFGEFREGLQETPFVCINEGLPKETKQDPSSVFRYLVDGSPQNVNRKFKSTIQINNPVRLVITANNHDVLRGLAGRRDLGGDDLEAIAQRLLHFELRPQATAWLQARGGRQFTNGWIAGESTPSRFVVAQHFLHLKKEVPFHSRTGRFLVEGAMTEDLRRAVVTYREGALEVVATMLQLLDSNSAQTPVEDNRVWFSAGAVEKRARRSEIGLPRGFGLQKIRQTIEVMAEGHPPRDLPGKNKTPVRMWGIPIERIKELAAEYGLESRKLWDLEMKPGAGELPTKIDHDELSRLVNEYESEKSDE